MFYSQANQDEFVFNILKKQNSGIFIDIGSNEPIHWNNSYFLEKVGWNGICIDIDQYDYSSRKCKFLCADALSFDYSVLYNEYHIPNLIDYLSIDIDYYTLDCLKRIPLDDYRFKVITIEHDSYRFGYTLKSEQKEILNNHGYFLLCSDITCLPLTENQYFEDWWVDRSYIDNTLIDKIKCEKIRCDNIVKKFYQL